MNKNENKEIENTKKNPRGIFDIYGHLSRPTVVMAIVFVVLMVLLTVMYLLTRDAAV